MIDQDVMRLLVLETDGEDIADVRDATDEEREHFFAGSPENSWFGIEADLPFQGWGYVDEIFGPKLETVGYVVAKEAK